MTDEETCCLCGKPIVSDVDAAHGAYHGAEARHWDCHVAKHGGSPSPRKLLAEFDAIYGRFKKSLDELRGTLRAEDKQFTRSAKRSRVLSPGESLPDEE